MDDKVGKLIETTKQQLHDCSFERFDYFEHNENHNTSRVN